MRGSGVNSRGLSVGIVGRETWGLIWTLDIESTTSIGGGITKVGLEGTRVDRADEEGESDLKKIGGEGKIKEVGEV